MTEELLDLSDVGTALQEMSGTGMSQRVRRDVLSDSSTIRGFGDDADNVIVIKWTTGTRRDKQTHLAGFMRE